MTTDIRAPGAGPAAGAGARPAPGTGPLGGPAPGGGAWLAGGNGLAGGSGLAGGNGLAARHGVAAGNGAAAGNGQRGSSGAAAGNGRRGSSGAAAGNGPRGSSGARGSNGGRPVPSAAPWRRAQLTAEQRATRGQSARRAAPRSVHGRWEPAPDRPDPVGLLEDQAASQAPELVPIRYGRMLASPFTFYRGAAAIMAADLAGTPVSGITVQLCGDAQLSNFGVFGTPERKLIFDIIDFDETLPGPWEWDVKRLAASFEIMGRLRRYSPDNRHAIVTAGMREYRKRMRRAAGLGTLSAWYDQLETGALLDLVHRQAPAGPPDRKEARRAKRQVAEAGTQDGIRVLTRRPAGAGGEPRIAADPPLIVPLEDLARPGPGWQDPAPVIRKLLASYRRALGRQGHPVAEFRYVHAARKVVGVGTAGTRCYLLLLVGRDAGDPLFLQVKEAQHAVLERYAGPSRYPNHGQRVVLGQRVMQAATDIFLGWQRVRGLDGVPRDYYVRQFHDWKGGADVDRMLVPGATVYAQICGAALARAHARSGDRIAIAAYLGQGDMFDRAMADFAVAYADQNERDHAAFAAAVKSGRLAAETGG